MSYADLVFKKNVFDILADGVSTEGQDVRAKWVDGIPAYTIEKFSIVNEYDLSKEFPIMTLRKTAFKSCIDEMLWIYQKQSNNVKDLNSHIWDQWADENGSIGRAYGYQIGTEYYENIDDNKKEDFKDFYLNHSIHSKENTGDDYVNNKLNQIDWVIWKLMYDRSNRRNIINMYNLKDLEYMHLYPCAFGLMLNVTGEILNATLLQRSQDFLTANNWNIVQYAVLMHMLAQVSGLKVGKLVHVINNAHIYDRHIEQVKELVSREPLPAPKFEMNPDIKNFYDFTVDDFKLIGYESHPQIKNIEVAI